MHRFVSNLAAVLLTAILAASCGKPAELQQANSGKLNGVHKYYYPDGTLYLEGTFKDSIPHGGFKQYFKNGKLFEEAFYVHGLQHGLTRRYYEDGKLSMEIPYDSGRIHGVRKKYRKDGGLAYEVPFHYDRPCIGLKEYFTSGNLVNNYPKLIIEEDNHVWDENRYSLKIRLSKEGEKVKFYRGTLTDGKYIGTHAEFIYLEKAGHGRIDYFLGPGDFVMERVNIIAEIKTDLGNQYIMQKAFNVAVENR
jgi:hypothetical protein